MLISHEHRFIFVKTRMTAGTSIEISLTPHMGPMDVITPIAPEEEADRIVAGHFPRNFLSIEAISPGFKIADRQAAMLFAKQNAQLHSPRVAFFNHMTATQIRRAVGQQLWERYRTIAVERIPYDRLISAYYFRIARGQAAAVTFSEFIRLDDQNLDNGLMYRGPRGKIYVDTIIPYHDLEKRLASELQSFGITLAEPLAHANSQYRTDRRHWSEVINEADRDFIKTRFAQDFEALGMTPSEAWSFER